MFRLFKPAAIKRIARTASLVKPRTRLAISIARLSTSHLKKPDELKVKAHIKKQEKPLEISSTLTREQVNKATIHFSAQQPMINSTVDLHRFVQRLLSKGYPGICDVQDKLPNEQYKIGWPPVPSPYMLWFRGHPNEQRDLMPSALRYIETPGNKFSLENTSMPRFLLRHPEYKNNKNMCEILSIMQHFGNPTRFLDFTSNPMVATHFACQDDDNDGILWILNPFRLNRATTLSEKECGIALSDSFDAQIRSLLPITDGPDELKEYTDLLLHTTLRPNLYTQSDIFKFIEKCKNDPVTKSKLQSAIAVDPGSANPRIAAQHGKFLIFGGKYYYDRAAMITKLNGHVYPQPVSLYSQIEKIQKDTNSDHPPLRCLRINKHQKRDMRASLSSIFGINNSSLMLDEDSKGVAEKEHQLFQRKR